MATTALQKITTRAKQIVRKHPQKKWASAIKEASREYRAGGIAGTRKKRKVGAVKKKKRVSGVRKNVATRRKIRAVGNVSANNTAASNIALIRRQLKEQLGWILVMIDQAKLKREKAKLRVRAADIRKKLKALS